MTHFGQTPSQLLKKEHPRRMAKEECMSPICGDVESVTRLQVFTPPQPKQLGRGLGAILAIRGIGDRIVVFHGGFQLCTYRWSGFPEADGTPFTLKPERCKGVPSAALACAEEMLKGVRDEADEDDNNDPAPMLARIAQAPSSSSGGGFMSSWKNAVRGLTKSSTANGSTSSVHGAPSVTPSSSSSRRLGDGASTSLYNATRLERSPVSQHLLHSSSSVASSSALSLPRRSSIGTTASTTAVTPLKAMAGRHVSIAVGDSTSVGRLFTCGYWDDSLKVHMVDSLRETASSAGHIGGITCLGTGSYFGTLLVTGGADSTVRVWVVEKPNLATALSSEPFYGEPLPEELSVAAASTSDAQSSGLTCVHVLCGHSASLSCLSLSIELDVIFSAGSDGLLCLHTLRKGQYVRTIMAMIGASVDVVLATTPGYLVAHSWSTLQVQIFWVNGQYLASTTMEER